MNKQKLDRHSISNWFKTYAMFFVLIIIWIAFQIMTKGTFLSLRNISNLIRQMATTGVLAVGMTICLIAGFFDMSVGYGSGLLGGICAVLIANNGTNPFIAMLVAIIGGVIMGLWNGTWVAYAKVPAFIVTLASNLIFRGLLLLLTQGASIPVRDKTFLVIGQSYLPSAAGYVLAAVSIVTLIFVSLRGDQRKKKYNLQSDSKYKRIINLMVYSLLILGFFAVMNAYQGAPVSVIIMLAIIVVMSVVLSQTKLGRHVYAIGGNSVATHLSGINNKRVILAVFVIMGAMTGVAGIMTTSRLAAATPTAGAGLELDAIASSVIGGVAMSGGSGNIYGSILGALVMASLTNGMSLLNINSDYQFIVKGIILLIAVWFDVQLRNKQN